MFFVLTCAEGTWLAGGGEKWEHVPVVEEVKTMLQEATHPLSFSVVFFLVPTHW
jgi:hypothetical protein